MCDDLATRAILNSGLVFRRSARHDQRGLAAGYFSHRLVQYMSMPIKLTVSHKRELHRHVHDHPEHSSTLLPSNQPITSRSQPQLLPAIRTVPLRSPRWQLTESHTAQVEPLLLAVLDIVTRNHGSPADVAANTIPWLIRINVLFWSIGGDSSGGKECLCGSSKTVALPCRSRSCCCTGSLARSSFALRDADFGIAVVCVGENTWRRTSITAVGGFSGSCRRRRCCVGAER